MGPGEGRGVYSDQTTLQLHRVIIAGGLEIPITEAGLCDLLKVSRTPVRAAVATLLELGLLQRAERGGFVSRKYPVREAAQENEIRAGLDGLAARWVSDRGCSSAELSELERTLSVYQSATHNYANGDGCHDFMAISGTFFKLIYEFARSPSLTACVRRSNALPFLQPENVTLPPVTPELTRIISDLKSYHEQLFECFKCRDPINAEIAAKKHRFCLFDLIICLIESHDPRIFPIITSVSRGIYAYKSIKSPEPQVG
jgi:GntR family transcriptional regulator of vanillate catabolism